MTLLHTCIPAALPDRPAQELGRAAAAQRERPIENADYTIQDIKKEFSSDIAKLVLDLTDVSKPEDGNRQVRKEIDRKHTLSACYVAKNIKLCDLIHNCESIVKYDKGFAKIYLKEFALLLSLLKGYTDDVLWNEAQQVCLEGFEVLKGKK